SSPDLPPRSPYTVGADSALTQGYTGQSWSRSVRGLPFAPDIEWEIRVALSILTRMACHAIHSFQVHTCPSFIARWAAESGGRPSINTRSLRIVISPRQN